MICIRSVILHGSIETTSLLYQVVISSCLRACFYTNIKRDVLRDRPSNIISDQTFTVSFLFRRETSFFTVPGTRLERIIHPIVVRRGKNWKRNRILFDVDEHVAHRETGSGKPEARPWRGPSIPRESLITTRKEISSSATASSERGEERSGIIRVTRRIHRHSRYSRYERILYPFAGSRTCTDSRTQAFSPSPTDGTTCPRLAFLRHPPRAVPAFTRFFSCVWRIYRRIFILSSRILSNTRPRWWVLVAYLRETCWLVAALYTRFAPYWVIERNVSSNLWFRVNWFR